MKGGSMMRIARGLALVVALTSTLVAQDTVHLSGLDRLYFEHVGDKNQSTLPAYLIKFLPAEVKLTDFSLRKVFNRVNDGEIEYDVEIRDFRLPLRQASDVWLRQIILGKQSERITSLWWALY